MESPRVEGASYSYYTCTYLDEFVADYDFPPNPTLANSLSDLVECEGGVSCFDFKFGAE